MLFFTASETVFMVSMGMCYFYGWQTYAQDDDDKGICSVDFKDVVFSILGLSLPDIIRVDLMKLFSSDTNYPHTYPLG